MKRIPDPSRPSDPDHPDNRKRCIDCERKLPIRDFAFPRARICIVCHTARIVNHCETVGPDPVMLLPPAPVRTKEEYNRNQRHYQRRRALVKAEILGTPPPKFPAKSRRCMHCGNDIPIALMATPRARICAQCERNELEHIDLSYDKKPTKRMVLRDPFPKKEGGK